jgi:hypothetical protein
MTWTSLEENIDPTKVLCLSILNTEDLCCVHIHFAIVTKRQKQISFSYTFQVAKAVVELFGEMIFVHVLFMVIHILEIY